MTAEQTQDDAPLFARQMRRGKSPGAYRTISEVATELDLPAHVLRFWETKFPVLSPLKRGGGRRYYRPEDVELLRRIKTLLHSEGYTIKGAQRVLRDPHALHTPHAPGSEVDEDDEKAGIGDEEPMSAETRRQLTDVLGELKALRRLLDEK